MKTRLMTVAIKNKGANEMENKLDTTDKIIDYIQRGGNCMAYMRCKIKANGDFYDTEICNKVFGEYIKIEWSKIFFIADECFVGYADGYHMFKIYIQNLKVRAFVHKMGFNLWAYAGLGKILKP